MKDNGKSKMVETPKAHAETSDASSGYHSDAHKDYMLHKNLILNAHPDARKYLESRGPLETLKDKARDAMRSKPGREERERKLQDRKVAVRKVNTLLDAWSEDIDSRSGQALQERERISARSMNEEDPYKHSGLYNDFDPVKRAEHTPQMDPQFPERIERSAQSISTLSKESTVMLNERVILGRAVVKLALKERDLITQRQPSELVQTDQDE